MFTTELVSLKNKILLPSRVGDTGFVCTCHRWESHSIYLDDVSFRMRYEFGCVQALDRTDSSCIFTGTWHVYGIFQYKSPLGQAFEEEILRNIRRRLVIPDPVPIDRTGKLVCRFKTSGSEVFQEDVIHFAIGTDHKADDHFVADTERFIRGDRTKLPLSPVIGFYE